MLTIIKNILFSNLPTTTRPSGIAKIEMIELPEGGFGLLCCWFFLGVNTGEGAVDVVCWFVSLCSSCGILTVVSLMVLLLWVEVEVVESLLLLLLLVFDS